MTDCHSWGQDDFAIHHRLLLKAKQERIPLQGSLALTHRCSLRCRHCYLGCQEEIRKHKDEELSGGEIKKIIDQASALGTLYFMLTGGEVMLRKDFVDIYEYIVKKGILVSVLTNATLITDEIVRSFRRYPPRIVEVTSYGATSATYEHITQVKGSCKQYMDGLHKLKQAGVRFSLKSVIMTANHHELHQIEEIADNFGVKYRYDTAIFPCIPHQDNGMRSNMTDGDHESGVNGSLHAPVALRLPVDKVLSLDFKEEQRSQSWQKFYNWAQQRKLHKNKMLYKCGAGRSTYHLDPYGRLQPCLLTTSHSTDLRKTSFQEGWFDIIALLLQVKAGEEYKCNDCEALDLCAGCPSVFLLETGTTDQVSDYICTMTKKRLEKMKEQAIFDNINIQ